MKGAPIRKLVAAAAFAVLGLTACGRDGDGNATPSPSPVAERPSSPATLGIVEPASGGVVDGSVARVRLELTGATITDQVTTNLRPDEGHIHLRLDGETITLLGTLEENLAELVGEPLTPGPHLLEAEFVAADHGPWNPRIISSVPFTVE